MKLKCIGDDRREAIDWLQDRTEWTRPLAETAMILLLREGVAITTDDGIMLTEDEDEAEKKARAKVTAHPMSNLKGIHFRNHGKIGLSKKNLRTGNKVAKTDYSSHAEDMIARQEGRAVEDHARFAEERSERLRVARER